MTEIRLTEGGAPIVVDLSEAVGDALDRSRVVTAMRRGGDSWLVAPTTKVGVAVVAGVTVWIRPKVEIRRILYPLGFTKKAGWRADTVDLAEVDDLLPALATAFCSRAERAMEMGLVQGYHERNDTLTVLRGRLREQEQMTRRFGIAIPLLVRFDDYTIDIAENQILRAATELLLRVPGVPADVKVRLRRLRVLLADVSPVVRGARLPQWTPTRLNERYQPALWLAEVLLRNNAVDHASGEVSVSGFLVDMAKVFEDYLVAALARAFAAHGGRVVAQDRHDLDAAGHIEMRPDLVWYRHGIPVAVIDAKYKAEKPSGFPYADLYQMLAYCTALDLGDGHLVYAKGNELERSHVVRHAGIEIHVRTLDLAALPSELEAQVDDLARRIVECHERRVCGVPG